MLEHTGAQTESNRRVRSAQRRETARIGHLNGHTGPCQPLGAASTVRRPAIERAIGNQPRAQQVTEGLPAEPVGRKRSSARSEHAAT
jgi:hypothetical protein